MSKLFNRDTRDMLRAHQYEMSIMSESTSDTDAFDLYVVTSDALMREYDALMQRISADIEAQKIALVDRVLAHYDEIDVEYALSDAIDEREDDLSHIRETHATIDQNEMKVYKK